MVAPRVSWFGPRAALEQMAVAAYGAYREAGHADNLAFLSPDDYNRFTEPMQQVVIAWLKRQAEKR